MLVPDISELAHIIQLETRESLEDLCETLAIGENPAADMQRFLTELSEGIAKAMLRALESVNASDELHQ